MERRLLVAILLTFLVLTAYQWLLPPAPPQTAKPAPSNRAATPSAAPSGTAPSGPATDAATAAAPVLPPVATVLADVAERRITVENGLVRAVFSNRGGNLISWQLMRYRDNEGKPLDLVPRDMPPNTAQPFSLKLESAEKTARVNGSLYAVQGGTPDTVNATASPATVVVKDREASGLHVRKQFRFEPNSYVVDLTPSVVDGTQALNPTIQWGPGLGDGVALAGSD